MGRRRTKHKSLPPHLKPIGNSFYFDHGLVNGKRKYTPLGQDYQDALRRWAEIAGADLKAGTTFDHAAIRYRRDVLPTKSPKTQDEYGRALVKLCKVFGPMALDAITAGITDEYLQRRSVRKADKDGKERGGVHAAAREIAVLSTVFNHARDWGYTNAANPRYGKRLPKAKRDVYMTDEQYRAIYDAADDLLRDVMDLAYLIGQRPSDTLRILRSDIRDGRLEVAPIKTLKRTRAKVSIEIAGELEAVLQRIQARPRTITSVRLIQMPNGNRVSLQMIEGRWVKARKAAGIPPAAAQFRDLRAKAATDVEDLAHAQKLLAHSSRSTTEDYVRGRVGDKVKALNRRVLGKG